MYITKFKSAPALTAVAALALMAVGCTDENYDLENIDTTVQVTVNDLTLPLNLGPVKFSSLVDLDGEECIETVGNEYVLVQSGDIDPQNIRVDRVVANAEVTTTTKRQVDIPYAPGTSADIERMEFPYTYDNNFDMDKYIKKLKSGKVTLPFTFTLSLFDMATGSDVDASISDLQIEIPVGFYGTYETPAGTTETITPANRVITFTGTRVPRNGEFTYEIDITDVDVEKILAQDNGSFIDYATGHLVFKGEINIVGGKLNFDQDVAYGIHTTELTASINLGRLTIEAITGEVQYSLDDLKGADIDLGNLPKELRDPQTNIVLNNPQLYLQLTNPVYDYNLQGSVGLKIRQLRNGQTAGTPAETVSPAVIRPVEGPQNYVLTAPGATVSSYYDGYAEPTPSRLDMNGLSTLVSGEGLPSALKVDLLSPQVSGEVVDFPLGVNLGDVTGKYTIYAPLSFGAGSQIVYEQTQQGWDFGSDQDFEISKLEIKAKVDSKLPVNLSLSAWPVDANGNEILDNGEHVALEVSPAVINPADGPVDLTITLTGKIQKIDGIRYAVKILSDGNTEALGPDQEIVLTDIRAKVTGHYTYTDEDK